MGRWKRIRGLCKYYTYHPYCRSNGIRASFFCFGLIIRYNTKIDCLILSLLPRPSTPPCLVVNSTVNSIPTMASRLAHYNFTEHTAFCVRACTARWNMKLEHETCVDRFGTRRWMRELKRPGWDILGKSCSTTRRTSRRKWIGSRRPPRGLSACHAAPGLSASFS